MSRETKFGYGFLFGGIGVPYLMALALGPLAAVIAASICTVLGFAFLSAGHLHRDQSAPGIQRGLMHTIWHFTFLGLLLGGAVGALSGSVWWLAQRRRIQESAKPQTKVQNEKPPTLADLFKSDLPNVLKVTDDGIGIQWNDGSVLRIKRQLYLDFPAKTKFVGFYIPVSDPVSDTRSFPACLRLAEDNAVQRSFDDWQKKVFVSGGFANEMTNMQDLTFSGRVLIYHEAFLSITQKADIIHAFTAKHLDVQFRGPDYLSTQVISWYNEHGVKGKP